MSPPVGDGGGRGRAGARLEVVCGGAYLRQRVCASKRSYSRWRRGRGRGRGWHTMVIAQRGVTQRASLWGFLISASGQRWVSYMEFLRNAVTLYRPIGLFWRKNVPLLAPLAAVRSPCWGVLWRRGLRRCAPFLWWVRPLSMP